MVLVASLKKNSPPLTWIVVAFARADPSGVIARDATASAMIVRRFIGCLLRERVGDQLEARVLVEPGRGRADKERVAVNGGERVDPGGRLRRSERPCGFGV